MNRHSLRLTLPLLFLAALWLNISAQESYRRYVPDRLGHAIEMRHVRQPDDYAGRVRSTIIRRLCPDPVSRGVLYIHGYNDYFFQTEMAQKFCDHGYDFYAVDLRRYGRSLMPGQKPFDARDMAGYFPDIDSALVEMHAAGLKEIVLMGHSTGGLLAAYYLARNAAPVKVDALILNSPFLDWNLGITEWAVPAVSALGAIFPDIPIPQGKSTAYAESLHWRHHGEWDYDTSLKLDQSPSVTAGWVRAIDKAQRYLHKANKPIHIPILLMYSAQSHNADIWDTTCSDADVVLDVGEIKRYGLLLGTDVTCVRVSGGLHDLLLSRPGVRSQVYKQIFAWMTKKISSPTELLPSHECSKNVRSLQTDTKMNKKIDNKKLTAEKAAKTYPGVAVDVADSNKVDTELVRQETAILNDNPHTDGI